ncbi:hypothetical protein ACH5RR_030308 [Cinchona calisaya]|uniref:Reverse transcriptase zinc-binding domain-containing protein n=1 Tax=Cinchona calisaya TaxID=153742 RepID=A0ABD2YXG5_9GENT
MFKVTRKIKDWSRVVEMERRTNFNSAKKIKELKQKISQLRREDIEDRGQHMRNLKQNLEDAYRGGKILESKVKGKRRNKIWRLLGTWCDTEEDMEQEICQYYSKLFESSCPTDFDEILDGIPTDFDGILDDRKRIEQIPLTLYNRKDRLYWKGTKDGEYSVKSAYAATKFRQGRRGHREDSRAREACSSRRNLGVWMSLWNMNIKHKLKHFIWICLNQVVPVNEVVFRRSEKDNSFCKCCEESIQTVEHCLFFCQHAKWIWRLVPAQWEGLNDLRGNFGVGGKV